MNHKTSTLFTPITFKNGIIAKNRFFKAAMSEQISQGHRPDPVYATLYQAWADGGAGVLVTGNVMVDYTALGGNYDVVIEDERDLPLLRAWAKAGTANNTILLMQINHPGKQSPKNLSPTPVAPSAIPLTGDTSKFFNPPKALSQPQIQDIIKRFGNTARIAEKAGFSGVQIHAAHGYLISQFLSPLHNQRQDGWGGSLSNRMRLLLEIYQEIKNQTTDKFIVCVKLNSADFQKGGFDETDSMAVVEKLVQMGVDLVEISGGNYESPAMLNGTKDSTKIREAYFLEYAKKVRSICTVPLVITGGFRSQTFMQEVISNGDLDMVGLGKPFALMPDLPNRIFHNTYQTINTPKPRTGIKMLDKTLGSMIEMNWYMYQMKRIGDGLTPNPKKSAWGILGSMLINQGFGAFGRERA